MGSLSTKYYLFNKIHGVDYTNILNNIKQDNLNLKTWSTQYDFINCDTQDLLQYYPKYPIYTKLIDYNIKKYNQNKIFNSSTMSVEQLHNSIVDDNMIIKYNNVRTIPETLSDINKELVFQNHYYYNYDQIYNKNLFIYNYKNVDYFQDYSDLLAREYDSFISNYQYSILERQSFFHLYFFKSLLNHIFEQRSDLKKVLNLNIDKFDQDVDITTTVNNHQTELINDVIKIITSHQYGFTNNSNSFISSFQSKQPLVNSITNIITLFNNYVNQTNLKERIINSFNDFFTNSTSFDFLSKIFNSTQIFDFIGLNSLTFQLYSQSTLSDFENLRILQTEYASTLTLFENQIIIYHETALNDFYTIKQCFYLLYLFRNRFEKFINIINQVSSSYVSNNIRLDDIYYFNKFTHLADLLRRWANFINYPIFDSKWRSYFNSTYQKSFLDKNKDTIKFAFIYEIYDIIENFIETDEFSNYLVKIQKHIFDHLRSIGLIERDVDWCSCDFPLKTYFKAFLKNIVHDDEYFTVDNMFDFITTQLDSTKYSYFSDYDDFITYIYLFNENYAYYMFEFYKSFVTSMNSNVFANAIHDVYLLY